MKQILISLLIFLIIMPVSCAYCDIDIQIDAEGTCGNYKIRHDSWDAGDQNSHQIAHFHLWRLSPYADLGSDSLDFWYERGGKYYDGNGLHVRYIGARTGPPQVAKYTLEDLTPQLVIKGNLCYKDKNLNDVPAKWAYVDLYDYDYSDGSYDSLIDYYIATDENGYFESSPMNNTDWDEDGGKLDIVVDFMASNPTGCVIDADGYPYHHSEGVYEDVSDELYMSWYTPDGETQKAWWVYDALYNGWNYLDDTVGYDMNYVEICWQWGHDADFLEWGFDTTHAIPWGTGTPEDPVGSPRIHIDGRDTVLGDPGGSANDPDVIIHEYGHCVMYKVFGDYAPPYDCSPHWMNGISEPCCAWWEGWAHFMPLAVFDDKYFTDTTYHLGPDVNVESVNLETRNGKLNFPDGESCEGNIAAALWDMIDSNNEDYDGMTVDFSEIWDVLHDQTTDEDTFREFYDSWCDLGHDRSKANAVTFQNRINYNEPPCAEIDLPESLHGYAKKVRIAVWTEDTDGIPPDIEVFYTQDNINWYQINIVLTSCGYSTLGEEWQYVNWNTTGVIDEDDRVWLRVTVTDDLGASSEDTTGPFTVDNVAPHNWQNFAPTDWVDDQTPDCTIEVKDITAGLDVSEAYYKYSTDGGSSWGGWISASCTGSDGATSYQTITAGSVPFNQDSGTQNMIKFSIDDAVGNTGESGEYTVRVDTTDPSAPAISSQTHPDEDEWYTNNDPSVTWTTPSDTSGISCYSYTLEQSATTTPDTTCDTTGNSGSYTDVADGIWYFHVRAKDNAGNWGGVDHYRVKIGSGEASTTDAVIALAIAAGSREYDPRLDVSGDGKVTPLDALMILQAAGGGR